MMMTMMMMTLASSEAPAAAGPKQHSRIIICTKQPLCLCVSLFVRLSVTVCCSITPNNIERAETQNACIYSESGSLEYDPVYIRTVWLVSVDIRSCVSPIA